MYAHLVTDTPVVLTQTLSTVCETVVSVDSEEQEDRCGAPEARAIPVESILILKDFTLFGLLQQVSLKEEGIIYPDQLSFCQATHVDLLFT